MEKAWNKSCLSCGLLLTQMKETSSDSYRQYNRILQTLMKLERKGVLELFAGDCPLEDTDTILGAEQHYTVCQYKLGRIENGHADRTGLSFPSSGISQSIFEIDNWRV